MAPFSPNDEGVICLISTDVLDGRNDAEQCPVRPVNCPLSFESLLMTG